jgi:hypothetical protein
MVSTGEMDDAMTKAASAMIGEHRLRMTRLLGECRYRKFEMGPQPGDQGVDGFVHIRECATRMM